jgi:hypothetical protein
MAFLVIRVTLDLRVSRVVAISDDCPNIRV